MSIKTTTIGSFPCDPHNHITIPNWFKLNLSHSTTQYNTFWNNKSVYNEDITKCVNDIVSVHKKYNVDIMTDGEIYRENYVHYFCRHLHGIDFKNTVTKTMRNGAASEQVPVIRNCIYNIKPGFLAEDWLRVNDTKLKITIPGPMTIADTLLNVYYPHVNNLYGVLIQIIQAEIKKLIDVGCIHIQIDEPLLSRHPYDALKFGIVNVDNCFAGIPSNVMTYIHICCGYPTHLDEHDYKKAENNSYMILADRLDKTNNIKAISIEDAHKHNCMDLFNKFKNKILILGVINVCTSKLPDINNTVKRIKQILKIIPKERLYLAPDCGLGFLSWNDAIERLEMLDKIRNLVV